MQRVAATGGQRADSHGGGRAWGRRHRAAACVLVVAAALAGCGEPDQPTAVPTDKASLAELRKADPDANTLLGGGPAEFRRRLAAARGRPVVVNQWASWCAACRREFPFLQRQALKLRGRVAFLGVNTKDSAGDARRFLARYPTPYPHLSDPDAAIARTFGGGHVWPTTAFYDVRGRVAFVHQGAYATEARLAKDIRRYALRG